MSYFSEALEAYMIREDLSNLDLARKSGIADPEISRWRLNKRQPTDKSMVKLVEALPEPVALKLCIAWAKDSLPADVRQKIVIQPAQLEDVPDLTREDWQQALDYFTKHCEHNSLLRHTLVGLHKLMTDAEALNPGTT